MNNILVVLSIYNKSNVLNKCIERFNNQSNKLWNMLIIDDGSTPNHKIIFNTIKKKYKNDNRFIFIYNDIHNGMSKTLNIGIDFFIKNNFKYFTWICDNNIYFNNYLKDLYLNCNGFVHSNYLKINKNKKINKIISKYNNFKEVFYKCNGIYSFMLNRDTIIKVGYFNTNTNDIYNLEYLYRTYIITNNINHINKFIMISTNKIQNKNKIYKLQLYFANILKKKKNKKLY